MQKKIKHYVWNPWVIFPGALLKYFTRLCFSNSPDDITPQYFLVFSDLTGNANKSYQSNYSPITSLAAGIWYIKHHMSNRRPMSFTNKVQYINLIGLLLSKILNFSVLHPNLSHFQARGQKPYYEKLVTI